MSEITKIHDEYFKLKQHGTSAYIRDANNFAKDNFEFVLSEAYNHDTHVAPSKEHTIGDNYGAGDLSRMEPCVFCEDYEKIESDKDALYEACKDALDLLRSCGDEHTGIAKRLEKAIAKADGKD